MNQDILNEFKKRETTAWDAVQIINDGDTVYAGAFGCISTYLLDAIAERSDLSNISVTGANFAKHSKLFEQTDRCHLYSPFLGVEDRKFQKQGRLDFTSVHLSQIDIWCRETCPPDVAMMQVSIPDDNGYMSLGNCGVICGKYVLEKADRVIVQINKNTPYVMGEDNLIHITDVDKIVYYDEDVLEIPSVTATPEIEQISGFIIDQIPDGACLQVGIGNIGNAVAFGLKEKNDLGIHTEMLTESLYFLMKNGNVTNKRKKYMPNRTIASFALGSKDMYEYINKNENVYFMPFPVVNDPATIGLNDNMISINSAIEVNLFGEVVADNMNGIQYSGCGGQIDYVRGAQRSKGGKSFIALPSTSIDKSGVVTSKIVSHFKPFTAVTTPRADVQYIVTEQGCINLKPLNMRDRVRAMISLAHPDFRLQLMQEAKDAGIL